MKTVKIHRLWHGKASVRDYIVTEAIKNKEDLLLECGTEAMKVPFEELSKGKVQKEWFRSQHNNGSHLQIYRLIDFKWKRNVAKQMTIFKNEKPPNITS